MSQLVSSPDSKVADASSKGSSVDDVFSTLSEGDEQDTLDLTTPLKTPKEKPKEKEVESEEEEDKEEDKEDQAEPEEEPVDELAELEEELEEPDEEKLALTVHVPRREILKKYPTLFKDFPALEKSYYRDQQFTQILGTIDEAKEAVENSKVLQRFSDDMIESGNTHNLLKMIKDNNPATFNSVVDNYLEHLAKVDEGAYHHVLGNVIKNTILGMVQEAKDSGDDDLRTAAALLNKYAFGSTKFVPPNKLSKEEDKSNKGESEISKREQDIIRTQIQNATSDINARVTGTIKNAINQHIDPKGHMTDFIKGVAVQKALDKVTGLIERDTRFGKIVEKLWERAAKDNFSKASQDDIKRAYLSRAKGLLTPVLQSVRNEALKGMGKRVKETKEDDIEDNDKGEKPQSRERSERRLSSDKTRATLDSVKGKSSYEALQELMGDK